LLPVTALVLPAEIMLKALILAPGSPSIVRLPDRGDVREYLTEQRAYKDRAAEPVAIGDRPVASARG
jgi:hypothetical protein